MNQITYRAKDTAVTDLAELSGIDEQCRFRTNTLRRHLGRRSGRDIRKSHAERRDQPKDQGGQVEAI